ncbi:hypothetical protein GCM10007086_06120 [Photobacterium aphoticum]|uniref:Uncharacterized protein n=1 Tax=Photobacterium aphoticum TaxID=754436 RepID=A0A0J1GSR2_9GAMM|nr:hypothetical protein ABT58_01455 [Photobacterium aphoticum]GHA35775.1 hypothetical protein GCM10007086_06120 [Photobacterium aphoticum]
MFLINKMLVMKIDKSTSMAGGDHCYHPTILVAFPNRVLRIKLDKTENADEKITIYKNSDRQDPEGSSSR